ncbi:hypothetical protein IJT10_00555 [bacterium]|nr:hypothetical protein [bacterium]
MRRLCLFLSLFLALSMSCWADEQTVIYRLNYNWLQKIDVADGKVLAERAVAGSENSTVEVTEHGVIVRQGNESKVYSKSDLTPIDLAVDSEKVIKSPLEDVKDKFTYQERRHWLIAGTETKIDGYNYWFSGTPQQIFTFGKNKISVLTENNLYIFRTFPKGNLVRKVSLRPIFDWTKWNNFLGVLIVAGCVFTCTSLAKKGKNLFIREIFGLSALDEAVGRATEMGKPVLFVPGVGEVDSTQTMAALSILGYVSDCTADYDIPIIVPNCSPIVMSMAQDIAEHAYIKAGRPDTYVEDYICYISGDQFGFASGTCGMMVREKPAAIFYMGTFLAEALILAETGYSTGAIQIAGTASASQLPFFVASCDYTLIGEELYAASAYLSKDPEQIGSLKGQDVAKAIIMILIILGVISVSLHWTWISCLWTVI